MLLVLGETSRCECDARRIHDASEPPQLTECHDGVVVLAEDVLEPSRGLDESRCGSAARGSSELGSVAGPLAVDAQLVQLPVVVARGALFEGTEALELLSREPFDRQIGSCRRERPGCGLEAVEEQK